MECSISEDDRSPTRLEKSDLEELERRRASRGVLDLNRPFLAHELH